MKIKCTGIRYFEEDEGKGLPKAVTVEIADDAVECAATPTDATGGMPDGDEVAELLEDAICEKAGAMPKDFKAKIDIRGAL